MLHKISMENHKEKFDEYILARFDFHITILWHVTILTTPNHKLVCEP